MTSDASRLAGPSPAAASHEAEAREALARGEFELLYQPIAQAAAPGLTAGFEALARWAHPTRGPLGPDDFMAVFEDHDLAIRFGEATLEAALGQMRAWLDAAVPDRPTALPQLAPARPGQHHRGGDEHDPDRDDGGEQHRGEGALHGVGERATHAGDTMRLPFHSPLPR